jgi:hypothetical protein
MSYKRNQVEEAILRMSEPDLARPSSQTRTRLKRLLDTDRRLGRTKHSTHPERASFAFYTTDAPGRGVELWFSQYEAFALLLGLNLMRHSWPQRLVVTVLRRVRPELEKLHAYVMTQDRSVLFDERMIRQQAKAGSRAVGTTKPVFLAISGERTPRSGSNPVAICHGDKQLTAFIHAQELGQTSTIVELVTAMHALSCELDKTKPSKRGRGSE